MLDIDHFKQFSDTWGHACGDEVIRLVSQCLVSGTRSGDVVGRLGGEEFGILLPEIDEAGANEIAERIRRSIESKTFLYGSQELTVTVSLGGSVAPREGAKLDVLVAHSDACLYRAKRAGRNQSVLERLSARPPNHP